MVQRFSGLQLNSTSSTADSSLQAYTVFIKSVMFDFWSLLTSAYVDRFSKCLSRQIPTEILYATAFKTST